MKRNKRIARGLAELCAKQRVSPDEAYYIGKRVLEGYRAVCWETAAGARLLTDAVSDYASDYRYSDEPPAPDCFTALQEAVIPLEVFAPERRKEAFDNAVSVMFRMEDMMTVVNATHIRMEKYPRKGHIYQEIIRLYYMNEVARSVDDLLSTLCMERSTFYRKKKEAVTLFGVLLLRMTPMGAILAKSPRRYSIGEQISML